MGSPELCAANAELCAANAELCAASPELCAANPELCAASPELCAANADLFGPNNLLCSNKLWRSKLWRRNHDWRRTWRIRRRQHDRRIRTRLLSLVILSPTPKNTKRRFADEGCPFVR